MKESELNDYRSDIDDVVCKLEAENEINLKSAFLPLLSVRVA